jgi:8-oxo-dGTP pyrophosphatase MutT (NUDIX family)
VSKPAEQPIEVPAAGGVLWRAGAGDRVEILLVHRPRYDDWSLPKGKRDPGESDEHCALREVEEETGMRAILGRELAPTIYRDRHGRLKQVRYWEMTVAGGTFEPGDEVDAVRWLSPADARAAISYERDRAVIDSFVALAEG